jgi:Flp pilus assembly protein protease CpaA
MAHKPFFPDPIFAWSFFGIIAVLTAIAAYIDTRKAIIPKWLTIGTLIVGFVVNIVRSALMASQNKPLWLFESGSVGLGILDGFLFSLIGGVFAFALLTGIWCLGLCGGGDVKVFLALGAWFGIVGFIYLYLMSVAVLWIWVVLAMVTRGATVKQIKKANPSVAKKKSGRELPDQVAPPKLRFTYSFPIAVATVVLMLLLHRGDLGLPPWNL